MLPAHQRLDADQATGLQVVHRLVVDPQFLLLQRAAQLEGDFDPLLGVSRELFGVQRVAIAAAALGLEQRRIGVAQQLFGAQCIAGKQADAEAGVDEQFMAVEAERLLERIENTLSQRRRLRRL